MLPCGGPSGPGRGRGWVGSGLRFQPGVQELLVLLVDSCVYVGMCGSLGRWFIASVSFSKASMPPSLGRTFAERQVKPAAWLTPGGRASGARTSHLHLWRARPRGQRSQLSTQARSLLPHERGGPWSGGRQPGQALPQPRLPTGSGSLSQGTELPPILGSTGPLCCPCRAPPEVGLRARVLCQVQFPGSPSWFLCPDVPCTLSRGPAHSASVHRDKKSRVRAEAMTQPCPAPLRG